VAMLSLIVMVTAGYEPVGRICFVFRKDDAYDVKIADHHTG
jgi:hypothetical protein